MRRRDRGRDAEGIGQGVQLGFRRVRWAWETGPVEREAAGLSTPSLLQNSSKNRKSKERKGEKRKEWTRIWAWGLFSRTHKNVLVSRK